MAHISKSNGSGKQAVNPIKRFWMYLQFLYFQYCIHLGLNELERWEVRLINTSLTLIILTSIYTTYLFLPGHLLMWARVFRSCFSWLSVALGLVDDVVMQMNSASGSSLSGGGSSGAHV